MKFEDIFDSMMLQFSWVLSFHIQVVAIYPFVFFFFFYCPNGGPTGYASSSLGIPQIVRSFPDEITQILRRPSSSLWVITGFLIGFLLVLLASTLLRTSLWVPGWFGGALSSGPGDLNPSFRFLGQGNK